MISARMRSVTTTVAAAGRFFGSLRRRSSHSVPAPASSKPARMATKTGWLAVCQGDSRLKSFCRLRRRNSPTDSVAAPVPVPIPM